jgi:fructokinase
MVSRVGRDALGDEIRAEMRRLSLDDAFVQADDVHATGTVSVRVDERGQPEYVIHGGAWDHLAWDDRLAELIRGAKAVCFGSLAQRHPTARDTIGRVLAEAKDLLTVFDVNLRQAFYTPDVLKSSLRAARWAKLNDDELVVLQRTFLLSGSGEGELVADLRRRFDLELVALTRGERGCLIQTGAESVEIPGEPVAVIDTVGAGDAFTAGLLCAVLKGRPVAQAARFANRLAGRVAASRGATPRFETTELERLRSSPP